MNILPKKRWHVRTKENIARVRKDEAEAAAKEQEERQRIENADREARLNLLKQKSKDKLVEYGVSESVPDTLTPTTEHINLFADFDSAIKTTNTEHDHEAKAKKEEYEKKIGYLTYLGQDTNEALGKKNWYEVAPDQSRFSRSNNIKETYDKLVLRDDDGKPKLNSNNEKNGEVAWKHKQRLDPLHLFSKHSPAKHVGNIAKTKDNPKEKHTLKCKDIKKKHSQDTADKLQKLREARLKREREEKHRTEMFLQGLNPTTTMKITEVINHRVKPKYNSQFNPELARQNYK